MLQAVTPEADKFVSRERPLNVLIFACDKQVEMIFDYKHVI